MDKMRLDDVVSAFGHDGKLARVTVQGDGAKIGGETYRALMLYPWTMGRDTAEPVLLPVNGALSQDESAPGIANVVTEALANTGGAVAPSAIAGVSSDGCAAELAAARLLGVQFPAICLIHTLALMMNSAVVESELLLRAEWMRDRVPTRHAPKAIQQQAGPLFTIIMNAIATQLVFGDDRSATLHLEYKAFCEKKGVSVFSHVHRGGQQHHILRREQSLSSVFARRDFIIEFLEEEIEARARYDKSVVPPAALQLLHYLRDPLVVRHLARVLLVFSVFVEQTLVFVGQPRASVASCRPRLEALDVKMEDVNPVRGAPSAAGLLVPYYVADPETFAAAHAVFPLAGRGPPIAAADRVRGAARVQARQDMFDAANAARAVLSSAAGFAAGYKFAADDTALCNMVKVMRGKLTDRHGPYLHAGPRADHVSASNLPAVTSASESHFALLRSVLHRSPAAKRTLLVARAGLTKNQPYLAIFVDRRLAQHGVGTTDDGRKEVAARQARHDTVAAAAAQAKAASRAAIDGEIRTRVARLRGYNDQYNTVASLNGLNVKTLKDMAKDYTVLYSRHVHPQVGKYVLPFRGSAPTKAILVQSVHVWMGLLRPQLVGVDAPQFVY